MKQLTLVTASLLFISSSIFSQTKNFIDLPFIETSAKVDTLVTPDRIYLKIILTEKDTKGKISVETLEQKMMDRLTSLGIDVKKQLMVSDLLSNYKKYILKEQDILKTKSYSLLVYDAKTAMNVMIELEKENISNIRIEKTEYSKMKELILALKTKAILQAKDNAVSMTKPLNQKVGNAIFISDLNFKNDASNNGTSQILIRGVSSLSGYASGVSHYEVPDIEFQKIEVKVGVEVKFRLE